MNLIDKILLKENINHLAFLFEEVKKDITETEEFKAWFGDSKVVDDSGKPLVVYHITPDKFTKFKRGVRSGLSGKGIYFSEHPLPQFGGIEMKVYLSIQNPITPKTELTGMREINSSGLPTKFIDDIFEKFPDFDGIINRSEIVVKSPNQIKSVNNQGTFDSGSDDIMESTESNSLESEARKYDSFEEFKAYGFDAILKDLRGIERDTIVIIPTEKVEIKWKEDYDNALETAKKEYNPKTAEPVDLIYDFKKDKYILDDGHNRYVSAQRNNQPISGVINHIEGNLEELEELYNKERDITLTDIWNNSR